MQLSSRLWGWMATVAMVQGLAGCGDGPPEPSPTVTPPSETATPTASPTATAGPTDTPTATDTPTSTPAVTPTATPDPELTPTTTPDPELTPTATANPEVTPTATVSPEVTPTATLVPEVTPTPTSPPTPTPEPDRDLDNDGVSTPADCNDADPLSYPGAPEVPYDGVDQDCSGADLTDQDADGYAGGPSGTDCDDLNPARNPGVTEVPYDGIDQDCTGTDLVDVDEDGQSPPLAGGTDCDDGDPTRYAGAPEVPYDGIDQDCSGADLVDVDNDGYPSDVVEGGTDCDDDQSSVHPDAGELPDGLDNDCDGKVDEDLNSTDDDLDGYSELEGDCNDYDNTIRPNATDIPYDTIDQDCLDGDLTDVDDDGADGGEGPDCDDLDPTSYPGATEVPYNDVDEDCSGADLVDVDADGFEGGPNGDDCDDEDPMVSPEVTEVPYDGIDQDCTGADLVDVDGDGYASTAVGGPDCNDASTSISPAASEVCDGIDNNCDGVIDTDAIDRVTVYTDADGDGYGNPATATQVCTPSSGQVSNNTDCNDSSAAANPAQAELPLDGLDNNCDGQVDNVSSTTLSPCPTAFTETFSGTTLPAQWKIMGSGNQVWTFSGGVARQSTAYSSIWTPGAVLSPSCATPAVYTVEVDTYLSSSGDNGHNGIVYGLKETTLSSVSDTNYSYYRTHSDHVTNWSGSSGETIFPTGVIVNQKWYRYKIEVNRTAGWMKVSLDGKLLGTVTGAQMAATGPRIGLWTADQAQFDNFSYRSP